MGDLDKLRGMKELVEREHNRATQQLFDLKQEVELEEEVEQALEVFAQKGANRLEVLSMAGLRAIYGKGYVFTRDDKDILVSDGEGQSDLLEGHGGGVVDILAVILRLLALKSGKGGAMMTLLLDEPLHNADHKTAIRASGFLKKMCDRLGLHILMSTHRPELTEEADITYEVKKLKLQGTVARRKE